MSKIGFDNQKYLETQSTRIRERIGQFGGKLYLEFGGKLFDDYHASRVLPGFAPDSKVRMLQQLRDDVEIVIAICAGDIEKNKVRGDLGIPYEEDVLRLIDEFRGMDLYVGSVVVTQYSGQSAANAFLKRLEALGVRSFRHYPRGLRQVRDLPRLEPAHRPPGEFSLRGGHGGPQRREHDRPLPPGGLRRDHGQLQPGRGGLPHPADHF